MSGDAVRAIRISKNMSQPEFAEVLNVSRSCIDAVESGRRAVSRKLRIKIAQTFGVDDEIIEAIARAKDSNKLAL
ncbi:helix-turn-helix transcriptional regulator [Paenibacillus antri]|uniref:Helix-turn-helix transcriptional regulator n=1 Tax=Paenibacillus antri TaxID=2582848 RepID=A0A5R9GG43_9BACL|nr:helix-turn-helix transcriptional regulator [Paenibacillus antri]TLS53386.1 helix-turn-helix transcriptional regulator [Paenibacillus antri]